MNYDELKQTAAKQALDFIEEDMVLGLGTGSTAAHFVSFLGDSVAQGLKVLCVPTSEATRTQAESLGIALTTLDKTPHIDLTIDGADEIDDQLRLIKGGGGALLREKIVAMASERMVVIADTSKMVESLGKYPLPIEIDQFGAEATRLMVESLAEEVNCNGPIKLRRGGDGKPFLTDGNNYILDCAFGSIPSPEDLEEALTIVPGVIETGLFIGIADKGLVAGPDGVTVIEPPEVDFDEF